MAWWAWVALGVLLLAVELGAVDAEFYLVFLGLSALVVGLVGLAGVGGPVWMQWLMFAALALVSLVYFRRKLYARLRRMEGALGEGVSGEWAVVQARIEPGALGRAELRGALWEARNAGPAPIAPGGRARVESVVGLVLSVRSAE
jgi:hypothetical protein